MTTTTTRDEIVLRKREILIRTSFFTYFSQMLHEEKMKILFKKFFIFSRESSGDVSRFANAEFIYFVSCLKLLI